ncbi:hypothetical protein DPM19_03595 [Actinomadura craniellae]|uniref:GP-PDE domain-containing protein n=1 Tax=Actinomadura craniellae TaxID=2231787 RepID=A0A365HDN8_9ACTN|nr:hypothetical protein [Actinomadura craniellae]RAY17240.1 hypothetical protein DPM19_03595 [Actinomadura craniellae]
MARVDRGEGTIAYLGVLLLVAGVVGAVAVSGVGGKVTEACADAICRVVGGECAAPAAGTAEGAGRPVSRLRTGGGAATPSPRPSARPPVREPVCKPDPEGRIPWVDRLHAHNDYENRNPLADALDNGATSVEVDVFQERDGTLSIRHDRNNDARHLILREQYLSYLALRAQQNGGEIYPGRSEPFEVFIEFKEGGADAYAQLIREMTTTRPPLPPDVRLVLPMPEKPIFDPVANTLGGEPIPANVTFSKGFEIRRDANDRPYCVLPEQLDATRPGYDPRIASRVTVLNGKFGDCLRNDGDEFRINPAERDRFGALVRRAHGSGHRVRIWGGPDGRQRRDFGTFWPCVRGDKCKGELRDGWWRTVLDTGVDYLVTDHLTRGSQWLRNCGS